MRQKTVVITGATGGLGRALVAVAESKGHRVISIQRQPGPANSTIVTDLSDAETAAADVTQRLSCLAPDGVDILINNAGVALLCPLASVSTVDVRRILEINLVAPAALTRVMWPLLHVRTGSVINIGSIASRLTIPTVGIYAGSKRALLTLTDATRIEGKAFGIQAGYIELGNVATGLHERVVREAVERLVERNLSEAHLLSRMMKRSEALAMEVRKHALEPVDAAARIWTVTEQKAVPRLTTIGRDAWRRRLIAACVPHCLIEWQLSRMI